MNTDTHTDKTLSRRLDSLPVPVRGLLRAVSWGYGGAVRLRTSVYNTLPGLRHTVNARVVSIGNLTVGGTGKTPVTEHVARRYIESSRKVAIISRGYGRPDRSEDLVVVSDGTGLLVSDWRRTGDEPQLLALHVPESVVIVCPDRVRSARMAIDQYGVDLVLLDDGFQHIRLVRDEDIVVLDSTQPLDSLYLIPRGTLREPPSALSRAGTVVLTHTDRCPDIERVIAEIRRYAPDVPVVCTRHKTSGVRVYTDDPDMACSTDLEGRRVVTFSALGNPSGFERSVRDTGAELVDTIRFPDHHVYTTADMDHVQNALNLNAADVAVTTEKDAIRLPSSDPGFPVNVLCIAIEVTTPPATDSKLWQNTL